MRLSFKTTRRRSPYEVQNRWPFPVALLLTAALIACSNNKTPNNAATDSTQVLVPVTDSSTDGNVPANELSPDEFFVWQVDADAKTIRRNPKLRQPSLGVDSLIRGLNALYPNVRLEKQRLSGDTLYTSIQDATALTEQMGSAGSEAYLATAVLNLSAAPGVRFVRIDFEPGSHAMPDVWSKDDFKGYKQVQ